MAAKQCTCWMRGVKKSWPKVLYSPSLHLQLIIAESTLALMVAYEVMCATFTRVSTVLSPTPKLAFLVAETG